MMSKFANIVVICLFAIGLAGCSDVRKQDVGMLAGGVAGALVGSQIGQGTGQMVAVAAGTLLGGYLGHAIGKSMDDSDRLKMSQALERTPTNQSYAWNNPDKGTQYTVTPTQTFETASGVCRSYTTQVVIDGKKEVLYGKACRTSNGAWKDAAA